VIGAELVESNKLLPKKTWSTLSKKLLYRRVAGEETDPLNTEIFEKALYLKEVKVRSCMVPRPEIQAVEISEGVEELKSKLIDSKLSRIIFTRIALTKF